MPTNATPSAPSKHQKVMNKKFWEEQITVGNLSFPRFMIAPMDGFTDSPFRRMVRKFSPDTLLWGEICHVSATAHMKSCKRLDYESIEKPLCYQISANRLDDIQEAIDKIVDSGFDMLNLNAGCPAKNVVKSGSGSALMEDIPRMVKILESVQKSLAGRIPMTIKMRAGFKVKNAVEVATAAIDCGIKMIVIHPRLQPDKHTGDCDYDVVREIKNKFKVPVIFSGSICSFNDAQRVYELTGVDGFMIGQAMIGAPWKLREMMDEAAGKDFVAPSFKDQLNFVLEHLELNNNFYGAFGFQCFKAQLPNYIGGVDRAKHMRTELLRSQSYEEMRSRLESILEEKTR